MRFETLLYFVTTADCKNMTHAARILHVSQQNISKEIKNLEEELGVRIMSRSKKGVSLTPAGETAYNYASKLLQEWNRFSSLFNSDKNTMSLAYHLSTDKQVKKILDIMSNTFSCSFYATLSFPAVQSLLEEKIKKEQYDLLVFQIEETLFNENAVINQSNYNYIILLTEPLLVMLNKSCIYPHSIFRAKDLKNFQFSYTTTDVTEKTLYQDIAERYGVSKIKYISMASDNHRENFFFQNVNCAALTVDSSIPYKKDDIRILPFEEEIILYTVLAVKKELLDNETIEKFIDIAKIVYS